MKRIPLLFPLVTLLLLAGPLDATFAASKFTVQRDSGVVVVSASDREVLRYQLERPANSKLSVESGCYFHPITTPKGVVLTEVAPTDHLHHRGVFLAWVEMHGKKDADFWGWGQYASKENRKIVNREISEFVTATGNAGFRAKSEWLADGEPLVVEELNATVRSVPSANVVDLTYALTADDDVTLSRWAFSGFCVRMRKDGKLEAEGPLGPVKLPNPVHTQPDSDWPAAKWYDFTLRLTNDDVAGVAVIDHPRNPPSLWHNHRDIRMLNPCIVAPQAVVMKAGRPLALRYRLVFHDGPVPRELLSRLAEEWAKE